VFFNDCERLGYDLVNGDPFDLKGGLGGSYSCHHGTNLPTRLMQYYSDDASITFTWIV
jgi:hypothetical protein